MAKKETAEEKLLKIIEATKKAKAGPSATVAVAATKPSVWRLTFSVQRVNIFLMAAAVAGLLFFLYQIKTGIALLNEDVSISVDAAAPKDLGSFAVPQMKDILFYLDKVAGRNIFQPYEKKAATEGAGSSSAVLSARLSKYKLVGVAWLDMPESATVMIENTSTHETRFLREGDKIDDVTVKTIFTDRVVFSYANEEMTVKL